jgi:hypothetical protein
MLSLIVIIHYFRLNLYHNERKNARVQRSGERGTLRHWWIGNIGGLRPLGIGIEQGTARSTPNNRPMWMRALVDRPLP